MAYQEAHRAPATDLAHRVFDATKAFFAMVGSAMIAAAAANRRLQIVERLNEKTDAELEALGMRREDIVRSVFRDMLDV